MLETDYLFTYHCSKITAYSSPSLSRTPPAENFCLAYGGSSYSGLKRLELVLGAVGTCPGYSESGLTYVRLDEGELYMVAYLCRALPCAI